jgi:hypothetical protein
MCVKHDRQYWAWATPGQPDARVGDQLTLRKQQTELIREICAGGRQCNDNPEDNR